MRLILCSFVVLAWTSGPFFGSKTPAPAPAVKAVAPTVDFDSLHAQARDALAQLRQSQAAHRMTVATAN